MANYIKGDTLRETAFGVRVAKTAQALPQSTTAAFATVSSGNVLVTSLYGVVSTAIQNQACTLAVGLSPTTGTANNSGVGTATSIANLEVGTFVTPQASSGKAGAMVVGAHAGDALYGPLAAFVAGPGSITWTTSASNTGAMSWYLTYVPLDTGASVA